ncbi:hypothetical protein VTO73DRAFT_2665 [Trametes versicolor]
MSRSPAHEGPDVPPFAAHESVSNLPPTTLRCATYGELMRDVCECSSHTPDHPVCARKNRSPRTRIATPHARTHAGTLQAPWRRRPCTHEDAACVVRPPCRSQAIDPMADFLPSSYSVTTSGPSRIGTPSAVRPAPTTSRAQKCTPRLPQRSHRPLHHRTTYTGHPVAAYEDTSAVRRHRHHLRHAIPVANAPDLPATSRFNGVPRTFKNTTTSSHAPRGTHMFEKFTCNSTYREPGRRAVGALQSVHYGVAADEQRIDIDTAPLEARPLPPFPRLATCPSSRRSAPLALDVSPNTPGLSHRNHQDMATYLYLARGGRPVASRPILVTYAIRDFSPAIPAPAFRSSERRSGSCTAAWIAQPPPTRWEKLCRESEGRFPRRETTTYGERERRRAAHRRRGSYDTGSGALSPP